MERRDGLARAIQAALAQSHFAVPPMQAWTQTEAPYAAGEVTQFGMHAGSRDLSRHR